MEKRSDRATRSDHLHKACEDECEDTKSEKLIQWPVVIAYRKHARMNQTTERID